MKKNKGTVLGGCRAQPPDETPTLKDLGIEKTQSSRWQKIAAIPEQTFDDFDDPVAKCHGAFFIR